MPATTGLLLAQGKPCFPARVHWHQERPKCLGVQSWSLPRSRTRRSGIMATLSVEGKAKKEGDKAKMEGDKTKKEGETTTIPGDGVRSQTTTTPEHGVLSHIITTPGDGASEEDTWVDPLLSYKKDPTKTWGDLYSTMRADKKSHLDDRLKKNLMLCGEAAQATYDTVDLQQWSRFRDESRFAPSNLLNPDRLRTESHFAELPDAGYTAKDNLDVETTTEAPDGQNTLNEANGQSTSSGETTRERKSQTTPGELPSNETSLDETTAERRPREATDITYMHASEASDIIQAVVRNRPGQDINQDSVWIGYVAYSKVRQDILVAWRGTLEPDEWLADGKLGQVRYKPYNSRGEAPTIAPEYCTARKIWFGVTAGSFALLSTVLTPPIAATFALGSAFVRWGKHAIAERKAHSPNVKEHVPWEPFVARLVAWSLIGALALEVSVAFPSAGDLVGLLLTLPLAFVAAIPFHHVVLPEISKKLPENWKLPPMLSKWLGKASAEDIWFPYKLYVAVVAAADVTFHFWHLSLPVEVASVLLPPTLAAGIRAGMQAGKREKDGSPAIYVHEGFHEIYTDPAGDTEEGPSEIKKTMKSPQKVLHERIAKLMADPDTPVSTISVTGHSLGGALAVLSSFDLVKSGCNFNKQTREYIPVTCYSFEGPRVGNPAFADEYNKLKEHGLTALRVINSLDIVPGVPRAFYLQNVYYILGSLLNQGDAVGVVIDAVENLGYFLRFPTCYNHVGAEITVDSTKVKWLKKMDGWNPLANVDKLGVYHNLEMVLHVLSGYNPRHAVPEAAKYPGFGGRFTRDFALANKSGDSLNPRFGIAPNWHSTLVPSVVAAEPPPPVDEEQAKTPVETEQAKPPVDILDRKAWDDSDAYHYGPNPLPAIIEPYNATESPPNSGVDQARVIGQGPQGKKHDKDGKWVNNGKNQWLEDLHHMTQADFDDRYPVKPPKKKKDSSTNGAISK